MRGLLALLLLLTLPHEALAARDKPTVQEQYELGLRYLKRGYYVKALEQFTTIRNLHRDDPLAVKAELAIADVYFDQGEWDQARVAYEDFMRLHPRHEDLDYVVFRLGLTAYKKAPKVAARDQTWTRQAVNTWSGYEARFSSSEHLPEVQEKLGEARDRLAHKEFIIGEFYLRREAWRATAGRMEGLLRAYPDAEDVPMALAHLAVCYARMGEPERAQQAADRLAAEYPGHRALRWLGRKAPELGGSVASGG